MIKRAGSPNLPARFTSWWDRVATNTHYETGSDWVRGPVMILTYAFT
jgi:hypothetical protein